MATRRRQTTKVLGSISSGAIKGTKDLTVASMRSASMVLGSTAGLFVGSPKEGDGDSSDPDDPNAKWIPAAKVRNDDAEALVNRRVFVKGRGKGTITSFMKSIGFGWPSLHTVTFDDGEEETMVLWNGGEKTGGTGSAATAGAKFRFIDPAEEEVDTQLEQWRHAAGVRKEDPDSLVGMRVFLKNRGPGEVMSYQKSPNFGVGFAGVGLGWPSLHAVKFDDGEETMLLLWDGDNKGAKFHLVEEEVFQNEEDDDDEFHSGDDDFHSGEDEEEEGVGASDEVDYSSGTLVVQLHGARNVHLRDEWSLITSKPPCVHVFFDEQRELSAHSSCAEER
jgi:hypothetical protein